MTEDSEQISTLIGQLVAERYRVRRKIGEGGMGTVYEAEHEAIEKRIALKVLHAEYSASPHVVGRFKQEAVSASRIKHSNVIEVFDFGQLPSGACFIAMEYLDGMDLADALESRGPFSADRAIRTVVQICKALEQAHARGVIHRDLKPENIFLQHTPEGEELVKIVDFGIAQLRKSDSAEKAEPSHRRLTKTGMIFGTPEYMAPEQARGQAVDPRSDIYATGVILYELLTGAVPFTGASFLEVLNQHTTAKVPPFCEANPKLTFSSELESVVMKALEKEGDDRYPTMKAFSHAILRTPEGRAWRAHTSSLEFFDEESAPAVDAEMRLENAEIPVSKPGEGTAMFGSPSVHPEPLADELPVHSSRALVTGVLAALLVISGGGAFFFWQQAQKAQSSPGVAATSELKPASSDVAVPEPSEAIEEVSENQASAEEATPEKSGGVILHVTTQPAGALVKKDGFQVCEAAPCDISVPSGQAVTLTAELGSQRGEAKVLAQSEQGVKIQLRAPSRVRKARPKPKEEAAPSPAPAPSPSPALCEVMVDGIKILRACE